MNPSLVLKNNPDYFISPSSGRFVFVPLTIQFLFIKNPYLAHVNTFLIMNRINALFCGLFVCASLNSTAQKSTSPVVDNAYITTILNTLASDEMRGRSALTKDIEKAADYIAGEFQSIGLEPYAEKNYRQTFQVQKISPSIPKVSIDQTTISPENVLILSRVKDLYLDAKSGAKVLKIEAGSDFSEEFRKIVQSGIQNAIVQVDPSFKDLFKRFQKIYGKESLVAEGNAVFTNSFVFILGHQISDNYQIELKNNYETIPMFNVAGIIPGKSKANEFVIFSGHYDHIGILVPEGQDSIANGADDDASGVTAMIALAKHFKKVNKNERTLIFVAFTGEELGMYGSTYFSKHINPDQVTAMINMEMIGKDSKFGPNTMYITGYNQSNLGELMQQNLKGSKFKFYPDPYPQQNLFYRSDNAVLAAQGVPAHSFSTSQMDQDTYYHTVKDEVSTLNIENIKASIEAIAIGITGIVNGKQTPSRVEKLRE